jgi:hypothetical protein
MTDKLKLPSSVPGSVQEMAGSSRNNADALKNKINAKGEEIIGLAVKIAEASLDGQTKVAARLRAAKSKAEEEQKMLLREFEDVCDEDFSRLKKEWEQLKTTLR